MAMNVGSINVNIGGGRSAPRQRFDCRAPETVVALPEDIAGDEYEFHISPNTRVVRVEGLRRVRRNWWPALVRTVGEEFPSHLFFELPHLVEALAITADTHGLHAPALEFLGLLTVTSARPESVSLPNLTFLHQAYLHGDHLQRVVLGPGSADALVTLYAPETAQLEVPFAPVRSGPALWHRPPSFRIALLEVTHWFTPRATRDDEATYHADNLVFEVGVGDDLADVAARAASLHVGPDAKIWTAGARIVADDELPLWLVVPRSTIKLQPRANFKIGDGANWEGIAEPTLAGTQHWAREARSLRTLMTGVDPPEPTVGVFCCVDVDPAVFRPRRGVKLTVYDDIEPLLAAAPDQILVIGGPRAFYDHLEERMRFHDCIRRVLIIGRPQGLTLQHNATGGLQEPGRWARDVGWLLQHVGIDTW